MERDEERASLVSGGMGAATSGRAANRRPLLIVASIAMVTLLAVCATQMREPAGTVRTPYQHNLRSGVKITVAFLLHDAHVALSTVAMGMAAPARPWGFNSALLCPKEGHSCSLPLEPPFSIPSACTRHTARNVALPLSWDIKKREEHSPVQWRLLLPHNPPHFCPCHLGRFLLGRDAEAIRRVVTLYPCLADVAAGWKRH
jgi:hypothetical protein